MERPRIRIATMLGLVLFCAVGFAAMRAASEDWARACFTLALGTLGFATLPLMLRRGPRRAFWIGFNAVGWGYLIACFGPWFGWNVRPHLVTTWAIERSAPYIVRPDAAANATTVQFIPDLVSWGSVAVTEVSTNGSSNRLYSGWPYPLPTIAMPPGPPGDPANLQRIGHSLMALVLAVIGGTTARRLAVVRAA